MFNHNILFFKQEVPNRVEALNMLADRLLKNDIVTDSFLDAILRREQQYPTGLQLNNGMGVAIPHTDANKVKHNQIGFMSLKHPVIFRQMGSDSEEVSVNMIFILCLKSSHNQLELLQKLMALFNDSNFINLLDNCTDQSSFFKLIESS